MPVLRINTALSIRVYDEFRITEFTSVVFMPKLSCKKFFCFSSSETLMLITRNHVQ